MKIKPEILVIDDDESICETLDVIIQSLGYYCVYYTRPDRAIEYFSKELNPIVLLDVNLPKIGGVELLAEFKRISPKTQVLMMTGEREIQAVVASLYNRATDFLLKPFTLDTVRASIERALDFYNILIEKETHEENILRDLRLASKVQSKLFQIPTNIPHKIKARVEPAMYVSGDYYQVISLSPNKTIFVMGDIEDHGVTSGLIGILFNSLVKEIAKTGELDPAEYLRKMNLELCNEISTHSMTCIVMVVDSEEKNIVYCRGGHPFPFLYPADRGEPRILSERSGHLLGILEDIEFKSNTIKYNPGDILFLYTDGLVNSLQSPVLEMLLQIHRTSHQKLDDMEVYLEKFIQESKKNTTFKDDISYFLCELV